MRLLTIFLLLTITCFSQHDDKKYYPLDDIKVWEYLMINSESSQEILVERLKENEYLLTKKFYLGNLAPIITYEVLEYRNNMLLIKAAGGGLLGGEVKEFFKKGIMFKYPLEINKKWEYELDSGIEFKYEVVSIHDSITVLEHSYKNVMEVEITKIDGTSTLIYYDFYAYGVGLIKVEIKSGVDRKPFLLLTKFSKN